METRSLSAGEESKQKAGAAVTGYPFLQGILPQRKCYSFLVGCSGFCFICGYLWQAVSCEGNTMGSQAERRWLALGLQSWLSGMTWAMLLLGSPTSSRMSCWKSSEVTKGASRVSPQRCLGYNRGDFLLLPCSFLPSQTRRGDSEWY